jgi:hypothetical protein
MSKSDLLDELVRGQVAFASRNINALIKLGILVIKNLLKRNLRVVVLDEKSLLSRFAPVEFFDKVAFVKSLDEISAQSEALVVVAPGSLKRYYKCDSKVTVLLLKSPARSLRGFKQYYLQRIPGTSDYILKPIGEVGAFRVRLTESGVEEVPGPEGVLGRAYTIIKESLFTYGEITVKDAVRIISKELGLDKAEARKVLLNLARKRYIAVVSGRITLP